MSSFWPLPNPRMSHAQLAQRRHSFPLVVPLKGFHCLIDVIPCLGLFLLAFLLLLIFSACPGISALSTNPTFTYVFAAFFISLWVRAGRDHLTLPIFSTFSQ